MKRYFSIVFLLGCTTPTTPLPVAPVLTPPAFTETTHGDSVWLYREALRGYSEYLNRYIDSLTAVYRLPPLPRVTATLPATTSKTCVNPPVKLPPLPNIALSETDEDAINVLISHIEDLRRLIVAHNRTLCKP